MNVEEMTREQVLEAIADCEAQESQLDAEYSDAAELARKLRAQRDACRERLIRLKARLAELEGSQRKAAQALTDAGVQTSQSDVSHAVRAVRESEQTGEPVTRAMRRLEHASSNATQPEQASSDTTQPEPAERSAKYVSLAWENVSLAVLEVVKLGAPKSPKLRSAVLARLREAIAKLEEDGNGSTDG